MNAEIEYQEALDYLYRYVDYSLTRNFRYSPEKFDLRRMFLLMERLGNPERQYPIIHVAGTKGKGSVSALCARSLQAAGYRVGLYTSPHLQDFAERLQLNGQPIPHAELAGLVEEIKPIAEQIPEITWFELTTALAFLFFARNHASAAVIEVGLGGRLDATNIVNPLVSVITKLSYDHMNILGDTLAKIAGEKAGIIKTGRPVVSSPQKDEALQVLIDISSERNAPLTLVGRDLLFGLETYSLDGQTLNVWPADQQSFMDTYLEKRTSGGWKPLRLMIPLLGYHQVENAATAYAALREARNQGLQISDANIQEGFTRVIWPARFEILRREPPVIIDSAHNQDSALKLRLALDDYFPGKPVILLFGASEDKDIRGMLSELLPRVQRVIATQSVHPRAMEAEKIVDLAHQAGCPAQAIVPLEAALVHALKLAGNQCAVVAAGSLFVAAATRQAWISLDPIHRSIPAAEQ